MGVARATTSTHKKTQEEMLDEEFKAKEIAEKKSSSKKKPSVKKKGSDSQGVNQSTEAKNSDEQDENLPAAQQGEDKVHYLENKKGEKPKEAAESQPLINEAAEYLKSSKDTISETVIILANEVDALFGNTRAMREYYDSTFVVSQKFFINTLGTGSYDIQSNLNLSLPNLRYNEERLRRWWSGLTEDESESIVTRKEYKDLNPWEFGNGIGVRISNPPAYTILTRASKNFLSEHFVHHFSEQIDWDSIRLWEEATSLYSDYAITKKLLFRFVNEANWGISEQKFSTTHGPSFIYSIDKNSLTSFDVRLITESENNLMYIQKYTAGFNYRTVLTPLDWCYLQITPELSWPRTNEFKSVWTIYVTLDAVFGKKK